MVDLSKAYQVMPRDDWRSNMPRRELLPVNKAEWTCDQAECDSMGACPWPCPKRAANG